MYTDGSGISGRVGAAAWCPAQRRYYAADMGLLTTCNVYVAELMGIYQALTLALTRRKTYSVKEVVIFTDNQAAIQSSERPRG